MGGQDWNGLYQEVLKNPGSRHFVTVAEGLFREERVEEAEAVCSRGLNVHPTQARGLTLMAEILRTKGKMDEAKNTLERVLRVDPENMKVNIRLGEILEEMEDFSGASRYFGIALIFSPENDYLQAKIKLLRNRVSAGQDTSPAFSAPKTATQIDTSPRNTDPGDETLPSVGDDYLATQPASVAFETDHDSFETDEPVAPEADNHEESQPTVESGQPIPIEGMVSASTPSESAPNEIQEIDADNLLEIVNQEKQNLSTPNAPILEEPSLDEVTAPLEIPVVSTSSPFEEFETDQVPIVEPSPKTQPMEAVKVESEKVVEPDNLLETQSVSSTNPFETLGGGLADPLLDSSDEDSELLAQGADDFAADVLSTDSAVEPDEVQTEPEAESGVEQISPDLEEMLALAEQEQRSLFPQGEEGEEITTLSLGKLYSRRGNRERAAEIYRRLLLKDPGNHDARLELEALDSSKAPVEKKTSINPFSKVADIEDNENLALVENRMKREKAEHLRSWLKRVKGEDSHVS